MAAAQLSTIVQSILSLIVLILIIFAWWPEQRMDLFREQMFALRAELFDFAMEGHVAFDDPAYRLLRTLMNGLIRYAHNLTPYRTTMLVLRFKYTSNLPANLWSASWEQALKNVEDKETRSKLEAFHSRATMLVVSQLVLSPGLLLATVPFLVLAAVFYAPWATLRDIYNAVYGKIPVALLEEEAAEAAKA
jgi:hypothetical protein